MTEGFQTVLAASDEECRDLFAGTANRLRTNEQQSIEKDFWVCWTPDALFNELEAGGPRLLFKGGTLLSKSCGLIERFSEDIHITVFREDIGQSATVEELETLNGKKRNARLEAIKVACQTYTHLRNLRLRYARVVHHGRIFMQDIATCSELRNHQKLNAYRGKIRIDLQSVEVACKIRIALLTRRPQVGFLLRPPNNLYIN